MSVLREIVVGIIGLTRERRHRSETPAGVTESQREVNMTEIEKRRKEKGLSREDLAEKVGVTWMAISLYEKRKREPKASILKRIAKVLECTMEDLV